jgi:hypothetical protein
MIVKSERPRLVLNAYVAFSQLQVTKTLTVTVDLYIKFSKNTYFQNTQHLLTFLLLIMHAILSTGFVVDYFSQGNVLSSNNYAH